MSTKMVNEIYISNLEIIDILADGIRKTLEENNDDNTSEYSIERLKEIVAFTALNKELKVNNMDITQYKKSNNSLEFDKIVNEIIGEIPLSSEKIIEILLTSDSDRADLEEYPKKLLDDINLGHYELWEQKEKKGYTKIKIGTSLAARNPKSFINEGGVVGIDFGTKSTVVVYQKDSTHILPMRVGTGTLSKNIEKKHYENPTIMEFINIEKFIKDYTNQDGRPRTYWNDLTISHDACDALKRSKSKDYNSYMNELKQWAGNKNKKIKIVDKKNYIQELKSFNEIEIHDFNPIEIYAYYLGLYINNMTNGIYFNYLLSFPVTYELETREKIRISFERGLKKSLPTSLIEQDDVMKEFRVEIGASEPAAYAITALTSFGFKPSGEEKVFYGIFDFGGGTTDFDFGIWREADSNIKQERRYDYVIDHFGAGGDRYLGGENILELLSFEIFKKNADKLRKDNISFRRPPETNEFIGSEILLSNSREASLNTKNLMEVIRPFWEKHEGYEKKIFEEGIKVNLFNNMTDPKADYDLECSQEDLESILRERIKKGVDNFFHSLRESYSTREDISKTAEINIFLAGNSSKSPLVMEIFNECIAKEIDKSDEKKITEEYFKIFPALGTEDSLKRLKERGITVNENDLEAPTGKTGVAYGLIKGRKSGKILVKDSNIKENISFKYYLGNEKKQIFEVLLDRDLEYNVWVSFIDASQPQFELYYTSQPMAKGRQLPIGDTSVRRKKLSIEKTNDNADIYIRFTGPTTIEYVVAEDEPSGESDYLSEIKKIELE